MLAVLAAPQSPFDAGSVAIAIAKSWAADGQSTLLIDADTTGSRLAQRYGAVAREQFSPAARGLPSLMTARTELTTIQAGEHSYLLDSETGSLWALFGPHHPDGGLLAAQWLAERAEHLSHIDKARPIVVASQLAVDADPLAPVIRAAPVAVVLASPKTAAEGRALAQRCSRAGLMSFERYQRLLLTDDRNPFDDDELFETTGLRVAARLGEISDDRLLRRQGTRRERATLSALDELGLRLSALRQACLDDDAQRREAADASGGHEVPAPPRSPSEAPAPSPALPSPLSPAQTSANGTSGSIEAGRAETGDADPHADGIPAAERHLGHARGGG